jgi:phospholipase C
VIRFASAGAVAVAAVIVAVAGQASGSAPRPTVVGPLTGIQKIQHVVVIMQENRSFDQYFGTFPGLPAGDGMPLGTCVAEPTKKDPSFCQKPYHSPVDESGGGPHDNAAFVNDLDGGKMDGFYGEVANTPLCKTPDATGCRNPGRIDVMGYHDGKDIPEHRDLRELG